MQFSIFDIIESGNWEKLLYYIVEFENLNPYDIDLVKLCDKFLEYMNKAKELDFRIPAKVIFIATFLLKLKLDLLFPQNQETEEKIKEILDIPKIDISNLELNLPIKRLPISQITLEELIYSLRKILELKDKKEKKISRLRRIKESMKEYFEEIEIDKIIEEVYQKILELVKYKDFLLFDEILEKNDFKEIYIKFVSILHLELQKKIKTEQKDFFDKIFIFTSK